MIKRCKGLFPLVLILALAGGAADALTVSLAQIDTSGLLLRQTVNAYVSVTDDAGEPVTDLPQGTFGLSESADGEHYTTVPLQRFEAKAGSSEGITFLLMIDNSGSMYDTPNATPTKDPAKMKITRAKEAMPRVPGEHDESQGQGRARRLQYALPPPGAPLCRQGAHRFPARPDPEARAGTRLTPSSTRASRQAPRSLPAWADARPSSPSPTARISPTSATPGSRTPSTAASSPPTRIRSSPARKRG